MIASLIRRLTLVTFKARLCFVLDAAITLVWNCNTATKKIPIVPQHLHLRLKHSFCKQDWKCISDLRPRFKSYWRYKILIGNLLVFFRHWVIATDQGVWWWSCFRGLESRSQIKYLRYIRVSRDSRHDNDARWRYLINLYVFNVAYIGGLDLDVQSLPTILKNRVLLKNEQDVRKRAERATDTLLLFKQLHAIT